MKRLASRLMTFAALAVGVTAFANDSVTLTGELKQWHKVTLTLDGPFAQERDKQPNAFTDLAFNVTFTHESGAPSYKVPGYFAADGDAANTSAESGTKWRAHLSPDKPGTWKYSVSFTSGKNAALEGGGKSLAPFAWGQRQLHHRCERQTWPRFPRTRPPAIRRETSPPVQGQAGRGGRESCGSVLTH